MLGLTSDQASALVRNSSIVIGLLGGAIAMLAALVVLSLVKGRGKTESRRDQGIKSTPGEFSAPFVGKGQRYSTVYDEDD